MAGSSRDASAVESEFFDEHIRENADFNPFTASGWRVIARQFGQVVGSRTDLALLDVGCGSGNSRQLYVEHCRRYVALDLSLEAVRTAAARFPDSSWLKADACRLPFPDEHFDVVAFSSVLHHIPDFVPALREARRVLRPAGRIFAFDPNLYHPAMALFRHPGSPLYLSQGVSPNERPLRPGQLRTAFAAAGLTLLDQHCQSGISYRSVAPPAIRAFLALYNFGDLLWQRLGLGHYFGTFVITAGEKPADGRDS